ncbi:MAG: hypothetical protein IT452_21680 [Planctomycetia bacterium]|nr:hypothetical protein [Planctomycetia bacterium]
MKRKASGIGVAAGMAACLLAAAATAAWIRRHEPVPGDPVVTEAHPPAGPQAPGHQGLSADVPPSGSPATSPVQPETPTATLPARVARLRKELKSQSASALSDASRALGAHEDPAWREAALGLLLERSPQDPAARRLLREFAEEAGHAEALQRLRALAAVLQFGACEELRTISHLVFGERDEEAVATMVRALSANRDPEAATIAADVGARHPAAEARHRATEEFTQVYCPDHAPRTEDE